MMRKISALLLAILLLLSACSQDVGGSKPMDALFEKTAASLESGHFFFAGKIHSVSAEKKMISFYDAEMEKSTFYKVEVTDDPFGYMPDRMITVCILGSAENFTERMTLGKNKEYFFDTTLWVQEDEAVFLLPTFYESLPERVEDALFYTDQEGRVAIDGGYEDYLTRLKKMANEAGYDCQKVLTAAKERLRLAAERNATYFKEQKFEKVDAKALKKTNETAAALLQRAEKTAATGEGIGNLLK